MNRIKEHYDGPGDGGLDALYDIFSASRDYEHYLITLLVAHEQVADGLGFHPQDFDDGLDVICRAIGKRISGHSETISEMSSIVDFSRHSNAKLLEEHEQIHFQWQDLMHSITCPRFEEEEGEDFSGLWDDDDESRM
jgi:hypothetical protein